MFLVAVHVVGRFFSFEIPCPAGPRHCGQFDLALALILSVFKAVKLMKTRRSDSNVWSHFKVFLSSILNPAGSREQYSVRKAD